MSRETAGVGVPDSQLFMRARVVGCGQNSRADTKKNRRKAGDLFCVRSKTGIESACSTAVRDLSFDFFLLTLRPC